MVRDVRFITVPQSSPLTEYAAHHVTAPTSTSAPSPQTLAGTVSTLPAFSGPSSSVQSSSVESSESSSEPSPDAGVRNFAFPADAKTADGKTSNATNAAGEADEIDSRFAPATSGVDQPADPGAADRGFSTNLAPAAAAPVSTGELQTAPGNTAGNNGPLNPLPELPANALAGKAAEGQPEPGSASVSSGTTISPASSIPPDTGAALPSSPAVPQTPAARGGEQPSSSTGSADPANSAPFNAVVATLHAPRVGPEPVSSSLAESTRAASGAATDASPRAQVENNRAAPAAGILSDALGAQFAPGVDSSIGQDTGSGAGAPASSASSNDPDAKGATNSSTKGQTSSPANASTPSSGDAEKTSVLADAATAFVAPVAVHDSSGNPASSGNVSSGSPAIAVSAPPPNGEMPTASEKSAAPELAPAHQMLDSAPLPPAGDAVPAALAAHLAADSATLQMHLGIHTTAFGNVEIHTVIEQSQVGVAIHGDRDMAHWFNSEVDTLETGLKGQHLNLTGVNFSERSLRGPDCQRISAGAATPKSPPEPNFVCRGDGN